MKPRQTRTITIRLPMELAESIESLAAEEQRSVNAQIVYLLYRVLLKVEHKEVGNETP